MSEESLAVARPTSVVVLVLGNILVGALLIGSSLCCGSWQLFLGDQYFIGGVPPPRQREQADRFIAFRKDQLPWYSSVRVGGVAGSLLVGIMWMIGGIGLWRMRPWARTLSQVGAALAIIVGGGLFLHQALLVNPTVSEFFRNDMIQLGPDASLEATLRSDAWIALATSGVLVCYGTLVLVAFCCGPMRGRSPEYSV